MSTIASTSRLDSLAMTLRTRGWGPRTAARVAGLLYLITTATSFAEFFVRSPLIAGGDVARTASNIVAHAQLFRVGILCDLLTVTGCVILNLALYELLAPVHGSLARLAAMFRMTEASVYGATTVGGLVVLSVLSGADYLQAFEPRQLQALARLFAGTQSSGFTIAMLFLCLGSTTYMYLLLRVILLPALAFEVILGLWLLVKGVRIPEHS